MSVRTGSYFHQPHVRQSLQVNPDRRAASASAQRPARRLTMNLNLSPHFARVHVPLAAFAMLLVLGHGLRSSAAANDRAAGPDCSLRTLRGVYGLVGSGVRGLGPGASESFTTLSMVTYDGYGTFTAIGTSHGAVTGVREGVAVTGTYYVNADCTGGQVTEIPGVPPLEDRFVIVESGREVRTVVISPLTTIATANLRKR
jgi:hypothetical protein